MSERDEAIRAANTLIETHLPGDEECGLCALAREFLSAIAPKWQPIGTQPMGTMLLLCDMKANEARDWTFVDWFAPNHGTTIRYDRKPTHFQCLPEPPQ